MHALFQGNLSIKGCLLESKEVSHRSRGTREARIRKFYLQRLNRSIRNDRLTLLQEYITNISQFQLPYNVSETSLQHGLSACFRGLLSQTSESVIRDRQGPLPSIYVCSGYLQFDPLVYTSVLTTKASHLIFKAWFLPGLTNYVRVAGLKTHRDSTASILPIIGLQVYIIKMRFSCWC